MYCTYERGEKKITLNQNKNNIKHGNAEKNNLNSNNGKESRGFGNFSKIPCTSSLSAGKAKIKLKREKN